MNLIYLAGPIAGKTYSDATDWRAEAKNFISTWDGTRTLSPLRCKATLADKPRIARDFAEYEKAGPFYTSRGIMARDYGDVLRCDGILVNLSDEGAPSLGTVMEIGWAYSLRKPIVAWVAPDSSYLKHPMLREALPFCYEYLDEAALALLDILGVTDATD